MAVPHFGDGSGREKPAWCGCRLAHGGGLAVLGSCELSACSSLVGAGHRECDLERPDVSIRRGRSLWVTVFGFGASVVDAPGRIRRQPGASVRDIGSGNPPWP